MQKYDDISYSMYINSCSLLKEFANDCYLLISNKRRHLKQVTIYLIYNIHWDSDLQMGLMFSLMNWLFA